MKFTSPLLEGLFIKRYKRFFVDIEIIEASKPMTVTAHTANTGSMKTCLQPGFKSYLSVHDDPKRKLKFSLEMLHNGKSFIGVNTSLANKLVIEAISNQVIEEVHGYQNIKPEVKIGDSRIDILLENHASLPACYIEVKNVSYVENNRATFPDAVTERGQKHLRELISIVESGLKAALIFVIQREDCEVYVANNSIDPEYCRLLREAHDKGVMILPYQCKINREEIVLQKRLPLDLEQKF